jgi:hypothetical protein
MEWQGKNTQWEDGIATDAKCHRYRSVRVVRRLQMAVLAVMKVTSAEESTPWSSPYQSQRNPLVLQFQTYYNEFALKFHHGGGIQSRFSQDAANLMFFYS